MTRVCDLHTHSYYSDGTLSPRQLLEAAQAAGLSAVALCDHNTVAGLPEFLDAAGDFSLEAVPGVEFSTDHEGVELHILAMFVQPRYFAAITDMMQQVLARKERSNMALVAALRQAGFDLDYAQIKAAANGYVNRAHIGAAMTRKGYTASVQAAFREYLDPDKGFYSPAQRLDAFETVRFIKSMGAVAVLAHPFLNLDEKGLRRFLEAAVPCGLDGMETLYPLFDEDQTRAAQAMADEFGLLHSGGSDFHGANKPYIQIGVGKGTLRVPAGFLEILKTRAAAI